MAGHSKFKNIMHRKDAQDKKRAKLFTKLAKEITVAAKLGTDEKFNHRLRNAILEAREANMPKDKIDNAINKATQAGVGNDYEEIRYEGYGPSGVAFMVIALSDNRHRTASEVRSIFTKYNGSLGESGSVNYMFRYAGFIYYNKSACSEERAFELAIEVQAEDCIVLDDEYEFICRADTFSNISTELANRIGKSKASALEWRPIEPIIITDVELAKKIIKMIDGLEDLDDVQSVVYNFEISDSVYESLK